MLGYTKDGKPLVGALPTELLHDGLPAGSVYIGAGCGNAASCAFFLRQRIICQDRPGTQVQMLRNGVQSCSFNGHGMPACSGAGKALAAMMSAGGEGEHAEVHEFVKTVLAPARFVAAEAAAAM